MSEGSGNRENSVRRISLALPLLACLLEACSPPPVVPVRELSRPREVVQVYRIVRPGDTLYSVSWAAGVDYRELAAWNAIAPPYVIHPGQRLSLVPTGRRPPAAAIGSPGATRVTALPEDGEGTGVTSIPERTGNVSKPVAEARPTAAAAAPATAHDRQAPERWQWPVRGRLVGSFDEVRGLDIAVESGTPVRAAAGGHVVYAGSGLRGYGQLVIVKHSDEYLSAYGHNRKLLVQEGDTIVPGQVIAESGSAPGRGEQVHFEIRRNGKPVNPAALLSKG